MVPHNPKTTSQKPINRREVLRAGLEGLAQQRELREKQGLPQRSTTRRKGLLSAKGNADVTTKVLV